MNNIKNLIPYNIIIMENHRVKWYDIMPDLITQFDASKYKKDSSDSELLKFIFEETFLMKGTKNPKWSILIAEVLEGPNLEILNAFQQIQMNISAILRVLQDNIKLYYSDNK